MIKARTAVVFGLLCAVGLFGLPAWAQAPRTFGTLSEVAHVVPAAAFQAGDSNAAWRFDGTPKPISVPARFAVTRTEFATGLQLPAGAVITRIELDGCDFDATNQLVAEVKRFGSPPGSAPGLGLMTSVTGATPGCALFPSSLTSGVTEADRTVDNVHYWYWLGVNAPASTDLAFANVRVFYELRVSPAPAVATFGDVPVGHPQHQFIEALVASGITVGCQASPPLFCPDEPLTRGQMAVFLSKGLGLHFAP